MNNEQYFEKDGWQLYLSTDSDGHLTVEIKHEDKSDVIEVDEDLSDVTGNFMRRYTTEFTEYAYAQREIDEQGLEHFDPTDCLV